VEDRSCRNRNDDDTQFTDAGVVHLRRLTQLGLLGLCGTHLTDAGLVHLEGLTKLTALYLRDTHVTESGVRELKRALPGVTIYR
jgi:hypothetical protein